MSSNRISVVIPVYNGMHYLAAAIDSVLAQSLPPVEIIVVDDGSTDVSAGVACSFGPPVRVLTQANLGPAAARNLGVEYAYGDLLAFLDADDLWLPNKLARQMQVLLDNSTCDAVLGGVENFISPELDATHRQTLAKAATQTGDVHVGALLIRRSAFQHVGVFDDRWRQADFVAWWARVRRLGLCHIVLPEIVLRRRLHANNLTRREKEGRQEYLAMLREHMHSLREGPASHHA